MAVKKASADKVSKDAKLIAAAILIASGSDPTDAQIKINMIEEVIG